MFLAGVSDNTRAPFQPFFRSCLIAYAVLARIGILRHGMQRSEAVLVRMRLFSTVDMMFKFIEVQGQVCGVVHARPAQTWPSFVRALNVYAHGVF